MDAGPAEQVETELLRLVAQLYYMDSLGQQEIAELTGVSRPKVSRLLNRARQLGIVRVWVEEFDPRNHQLEEGLCNAFGLNRALVIRTLGRTETESVRNSVGYFAAPFVADWITANTVVGVAGGRTLAGLVQYIQPRTPTPGVSFVQLMGNFGAQVSYCDAVELCRLFAGRFQGPYYTLNSPAVAPDASSCRAFLAHQDVKVIWSLFDAMQLAFVGIGSLEDSSFIERGVVQPAEVSRLLAHGAVGELCGRFFDATGNACDPSYQERVIGIGLEELRNKREVVVVTVGARRAVAIHAALKSGLAKSIVIDEKGAEAVLDLCRSDT